MIDFNHSLTAKKRARIRQLRDNGCTARYIANVAQLPLALVAAYIKTLPSVRESRAIKAEALDGTPRQKPRVNDFEVGDRVRFGIGNKKDREYKIGYIVSLEPRGYVLIGEEATGDVYRVSKGLAAYEPTIEEIYERRAPEARRILEHPLMAERRGRIGRVDWDIPEWPGMADKTLGSRD